MLVVIPLRDAHEWTRARSVRQGTSVGRGRAGISCIHVDCGINSSIVAGIRNGGILRLDHDRRERMDARSRQGRTVGANLQHRRREGRDEVVGTVVPVVSAAVEEFAAGRDLEVGQAFGNDQGRTLRGW